MRARSPWPSPVSRWISRRVSFSLSLVIRRRTNRRRPHTSPCPQTYRARVEACARPEALESQTRARATFPTAPLADAARNAAKTAAAAVGSVWDCSPWWARASPRSPPSSFDKTPRTSESAIACVAVYARNPSSRANTRRVGWSVDSSVPRRFDARSSRDASTRDTAPRARDRVQRWRSVSEECVRYGPIVRTIRRSSRRSTRRRIIRVRRVDERAASGRARDAVPARA